MPIKGLTDEKSLSLGRALPRIGKLRKGGEKRDHKTKTGRDGKPIKIMGLDLDYFRVDLEDEFANLLPDFTELYGDTPMEFQHVRFFTPDVEDAFSSWYKTYDAAQTLLHKCDGDNQHLHYQPETGKWNKALIPCRALCINTRKGTASEDEAKKACKHTGTLKVVLTDFTFKTGAYGYFEIVTHSIHDIINLHGGLSFLQQQFGTLVGIEFILGRTERLISTPMGKDSDGNIKRGKTKKSLLYIRPSNDFVQRQLLAPSEPTRLLPASVDSREALGSGDTRRVAALPEPEADVVTDATIVENGAEADSDPSPPPKNEPTSAEQDGDSKSVPASAVRANQVFKYLTSMFRDREAFNDYLIKHGPDSQKPVFSWEETATEIAGRSFLHRCDLIYDYEMPTVCGILGAATLKAYLQVEGNDFASAWDAVVLHHMATATGPAPEAEDVPDEKPTLPDLPPTPKVDEPPSDFKGAGRRKINTAWTNLSDDQRDHTDGESSFKDKAIDLLKANAALSADKLKDAVMVEFEAEVLDEAG